MPPAALRAYDGGDKKIIAEIELGKWYYFHTVLDFNEETYDLDFGQSDITRNGQSRL